MAEQSHLDHESSAVQKHLEIMQGVINRMAENSRSCKVWCVTLVSAILVLMEQTGGSRHALTALVPTLLFLVLDAYYLALERAFRESYGGFVNKLNLGGLSLRDIYEIEPVGMGLVLVARCLGSVSVWLFYLLVAATITLAWLLIIP